MISLEKGDQLTFPYSKQVEWEECYYKLLYTLELLRRGFDMRKLGN